MGAVLYGLGPLAAGFLLDLLIGDPPRFPHPVRTVGALIAGLERLLRRVFPATPRGELMGGALLALLVPLAGAGAVWGMLRLAARVGVWLWLALETLLCYQLLAAGSLRVESVPVQRALEGGDLPAARRALSRIVGRDTAALDREAAARAAIETVAENTTDAVVSPLLFLALGGAAGGMLYKAVNTLDSMVGYKNERYLHFGRASARLDDLLNWIPARLAALLACLGALLLPGYRGGEALRIWRRDGRNHPSPNSAQTEAAFAGALGVRLGGPSHYGGRLVDKQTIGDPSRPVEPADIGRANRLMLLCAALALPPALLLRAAMLLIIA